MSDRYPRSPIWDDHIANRARAYAVGWTRSRPRVARGVARRPAHGQLQAAAAAPRARRDPRGDRCGEMPHERSGAGRDRMPGAITAAVAGSALGARRRRAPVRVTAGHALADQAQIPTSVRRVATALPPSGSSVSASPRLTSPQTTSRSATRLDLVHPLHDGASIPSLSHTRMGSGVGLCGAVAVWPVAACVHPCSRPRPCSASSTTTAAASQRRKASPVTRRETTQRHHAPPVRTFSARPRRGARWRRGALRGPHARRRARRAARPERAQRERALAD